MERSQEQRLNFLIEKLRKENNSLRTLRVPSDLEARRHLLRSLMNVREPAPLDPEVQAVQDAYLQERAREKGIVKLADIPSVNEVWGEKKPFGDQLSIWQGDITRLEVDAIVNAANSQMLGCFIPMHTCIDNCIHTYAGMELRLECDRIMRRQRVRFGKDYVQPTAIPILTDAYNLPAKKIVHVVGPIVMDELTEQNRDELALCYSSTLDLCAENNLRSVAFCCLSTGVFHFPNAEAARIAVASVTKWLQKHPEAMDRVIFNVFKDEDRFFYDQQFGNFR